MRRGFAFGALVTALLLSLLTIATAQQSLLPTIQAVRAKYPARNLTPAQQAAMLNEVAAQHPGWGLLAKPSGNNCPHASGVLVACDILVFRATLQHYDVLGDAEGEARPAFGLAGDPPHTVEASRFVAPVPVGPTDPPVQPPPPPPPPVDDAALKAIEKRLALIEDLLKLVLSQQPSDVNLQPIIERLAAIEAELQRERAIELGIPFLGTAKGRIK